MPLFYRTLINRTTSEKAPSLLDKPTGVGDIKRNIQRITNVSPDKQRILVEGMVVPLNGVMLDRELKALDGKTLYMSIDNDIRKHFSIEDAAKIDWDLLVKDKMLSRECQESMISLLQIADMSGSARPVADYWRKLKTVDRQRVLGDPKIKPLFDAYAQRAFQLEALVSPSPLVEEGIASGAPVEALTQAAGSVVNTTPPPPPPPPKYGDRCSTSFLSSGFGGAALQAPPLVPSQSKTDASTELLRASSAPAGDHLPKSADAPQKPSDASATASSAGASLSPEEQFKGIVSNFETVINEQAKKKVSKKAIVAARELHEVLTKKVDAFLAMTPTDRLANKTAFLNEVSAEVDKKYSLLQRELSFGDRLTNMLNQFVNLIRRLCHKPPKYAMLQGFLTGKARDVEAAVTRDIELLTPPPAPR